LLLLVIVDKQVAIVRVLSQRVIFQGRGESRRPIGDEKQISNGNKKPLSKHYIFDRIEAVNLPIHCYESRFGSSASRKAPLRALREVGIGSRFAPSGWFERPAADRAGIQ